MKCNECGEAESDWVGGRCECERTFIAQNHGQDIVEAMAMLITAKKRLQMTANLIRGGEFAEAYDMAIEVENWMFELRSELNKAQRRAEREAP
jgi:hypothetical protein